MPDHTGAGLRRRFRVRSERVQPNSIVPPPPHASPAATQPALHHHEAPPTLLTVATNEATRQAKPKHRQTLIAPMASVQHPAPNHWVVHLASRSAPDSEVTVELRMSKVTADKLAHLEAARSA